MARTNYTFEKRQRQLAKMKKKEEKRRKKLEKAGEEAQSDHPAVADEQNTATNGGGDATLNDGQAVED